MSLNEIAMVLGFVIGLAMGVMLGYTVKKEENHISIDYGNGNDKSYMVTSKRLRNGKLLITEIEEISKY